MFMLELIEKFVHVSVVLVVWRGFLKLELCLCALPKLKSIHASGITQLA